LTPPHIDYQSDSQNPKKGEFAGDISATSGKIPHAELETAPIHSFRVKRINRGARANLDKAHLHHLTHQP